MVKIYVAPEDDSTKAKVKAWLHNRKVDAQYLWSEHKEEIMILGPAAIGAFGLGVKAVGKYVNLRKQEQVKDLRVWDAVLGHYWELKRKLDNDEWVEVERRKGAGESYGSIFRSMNVLK